MIGEEAIGDFAHLGSAEAFRTARLGVARISSPRRYSGASARRDFDHLLGDDRYLARAREVGDSLAAEDGAAQAARIVLDTLEELARTCRVGCLLQELR